MAFLRELLGGGIKVKKARDDGMMPWSPTVVNIKRLRNRRHRRRTLLLIGLLVLSGLCLACSAFAMISQAAQQPPAAIQQPQLTQTPNPTPTSTSTPEPGPTPTRVMIEATVGLDRQAGAPGETISVTVHANDEADVHVVWDNAISLAYAETTGGAALLQFKIPDRASAGQHLVMIDVTNGYSLKRHVLVIDVYN